LQFVGVTVSAQIHAMLCTQSAQIHIKVMCTLGFRCDYRGVGGMFEVRTMFVIIGIYN
jgi:hypothetical protein